MKGLMLILGVLFLGTAVFAQGDSAEQVVLETNHGRIVLEVDLKNAPKTGQSFLDNVDAGTYDGLIFHRVIPDFMIQGGGFTREMKPVPTDKSLMNEADNGLKNLRGTVAMARRQDPHSASIQFFINVVDNAALDHTGKTPQGWGYTVFARVVEGMEVADAITEVPRGQVGPFRDVPEEPVIIESAKRRAQSTTAE
ncbi:MAG: peptidyl-prolyl cis-trans isomerase [bacterium]|nr:peptidyl-prolyl cis-trans isomerase [bacterium]